MINPYKMKKMFAITFTAMAPTVAFYLSIQLLNLMFALIIFLLLCLISYLMSIKMLKNPFSDMLEGKGMLAFDLTSTGILKPFLIQPQMPMVTGKLNGKTIRSVFDRNAVFTLKPPHNQKEPMIIENKNGEVVYKFNLKENEYSDNRFLLHPVPVMIYSSILGTFITKEWLSNKESETFAQHQILYLNRALEDHDKDMKHFVRYVINLLKPKAGGMAGNWVTWIIIVVVILILGAFFAPKFLPMATNTISGLTSGGSAINPIG